MPTIDSFGPNNYTEKMTSKYLLNPKNGFLVLQYIHEKGMLHRDIKSTNILVQDDGTIKVADLGLVR